MNILAALVKKIIEEQETIIGPIALEQAKKVQGLKIDWLNHEVAIEGKADQVLQNLVDQYKVLFGQTSVEVCRDVVFRFKNQITPDQLPQVLR